MHAIVSKQEIIHIFELADKLKANNEECDWLKRKTIVLFFRKVALEREFLLKRE